MATRIEHAEVTAGGRFWIGAGYGLIATLAMTIVMVLATWSGASPMPAPIPLVIVRDVIGPEVTRPVAIVLAVLAHFGYGALWAGLFAAVTRPVTPLKGMALGVFLWFLMQVLVLPLIGWGPFGGKLHPLVWFATLVLHLVYGAVLGLFLDRDADDSTIRAHHRLG